MMVSDRTSKGLLAACVFTGATLLFLLEPMVARSILPWFGGGASVWTTCMLFFQVVLLAGYTYAHLSATRLSPKAQVWVQIALILTAIALLPVIPPERLRPGIGTDANPIARVLLVLTVTIGLPFLVLSATGTLVQTWWARLHPDSPPYRLYALSNAGSLVGLLAYPALVEPMLGLKQQAWAWSGAMIGFGVLCGLSAWMAKGRAADSAAPPALPQHSSRGFARTLAWILLPMVASVMLLAVTAAMTQHVAPIPFLWVLPLTVYLLSFILCFEYPQAYRRWAFVPMYGLALVAVAGFIVFGRPHLPLPVQLAVYCLLLFSGCMICHGETYRLRPPAAGLSRFYLCLAIGGALGGVFAAVIAPLTFAGMWELHCSLAACALICLAMLWASPASALRRGRPVWAWFAISLFAAMVGTVLYLDISGNLQGSRVLLRTRNFYAAMSVERGNLRQPGDEALMLRHGGIIHGLQLQDPARWHLPLSYYWEKTAVGRLLAADSGPRHVGIVGLGAGALAAYARPGDRLTMYEINPQVIAVARDRFTFLKNTPAEVRVIEGDGRISLQRQEDQAFDILVLDAFSGDSVPAHLLTREAIEIYARHLKPDGVLAFNITNHYLNLEPVIARAAQAFGFSAVIADTEARESDPLRFDATWMLLSRDPGRLDTEALREVCRPARTDDRVPLWTDDRSNLLRILH